MTSLPFTRIAILDRGTTALRAIHAVREYAWETRADLRAVVLYDDADRGALWVREADDAVPVGAQLAAAVAAARVDALWASWRSIAPLPVVAALAADAGIANVGAPAAVLSWLAEPGALARLAQAVDLPLAAEAAEGQRLRLDVLADAPGTVWVLGPRHSLLHRDGRPLIEELEPGAPPQRLREIARRLVRAIDLCGAATVELWRDPAGDALALAAFVPHLEPGHALAEAATGLDLMKLQLHLPPAARWRACRRCRRRSRWARSWPSNRPAPIGFNCCACRPASACASMPASARATRSAATSPAWWCAAATAPRRSAGCAAPWSTPPWCCAAAWPTRRCCSTRSARSRAAATAAPTRPCCARRWRRTTTKRRWRRRSSTPPRRAGGRACRARSAASSSSAMPGRSTA
ncbi:MAG: biotin carboxylase N-terminal domain-containing protein [Candidatus Binatia bacterium]